MTFRRRVVVLVAAAVATSICGASAVVYLVTRAELGARVDDALRAQPAHVTFVEPRPIKSLTARRAVKRLLTVRMERWGRAPEVSGGADGRRPTAGGTGEAVAASEDRGVDNLAWRTLLPSVAARLTAKPPSSSRSQPRPPPLSAASSGALRSGPSSPPSWDVARLPSGGRVPQVLISGGALRAPTIAQAVTRNGLLLEPFGADALPTTERMIAVASGRAKAFFSDQELHGVPLRVYTAKGPAGTAVSVAQPLTEVDATLRRLLLILVLVSASGVAAAAGLGVLVARRALAPVRRLTEATEHVAATQDLSRRLPEAGRDELARLAGSFNTMLAALDGARAAQRQLVADASHELRTPLTSVRMNVEALARSTALPAPERHRLGTSAGQLEELSGLVTDLVDLARPAPPAAERETLALDRIVADAVERVRRRAPESELRAELRPCLVDAVRGGLHRAVVNLLDNAIAHGGGGTVEVEARDGCVTVRDHGPGIAAEDLPHVFDRFYRAPRARSRPGAGLGLAIVRQFAESHGGTVRAENAADGGARLVLALPVSATS